MDSSQKSTDSQSLSSTPINDHPVTALPYYNIYLVRYFPVEGGARRVYYFQCMSNGVSNPNQGYFHSYIIPNNPSHHAIMHPEYIDYLVDVDNYYGNNFINPLDLASVSSSEAEEAAGVNEWSPDDLDGTTLVGESDNGSEAGDEEEEDEDDDEGEEVEEDEDEEEEEDEDGEEEEEEEEEPSNSDENENKDEASDLGLVDLLMETMDFPVLDGFADMLPHNHHHVLLWILFNPTELLVLDENPWPQRETAEITQSVAPQELERDAAQRHDEEVALERELQPQHQAKSWLEFMGDSVPDEDCPLPAKPPCCSLPAPIQRPSRLLPLILSVGARSPAPDTSDVDERSRLGFGGGPTNETASEVAEKRETLPAEVQRAERSPSPPLQEARPEWIIDSAGDMTSEELEEAMREEEDRWNSILSMIEESNTSPGPEQSLPTPRTQVTFHLTDFTQMADCVETADLSIHIYASTGVVPVVIDSRQIFGLFDYYYRMSHMTWVLPPHKDHQIVAYGVHWREKAMQDAEDLAIRIAQTGGQVIVRVGWQMMNLPEGVAFLNWMRSFWAQGALQDVGHYWGGGWPAVAEYDFEEFMA